MMVKIWAETDRQAGLMARKRALMVEAATRAFLESGYAESSVNRIAEDAGVSIKTLYRHFENKDDLFSAVMQSVCDAQAEAVGASLAWYSEAPETALPRVAFAYVRHALSGDQLALYRVVARDAHRFPELGRRYREEVIGRRDTALADYLAMWADKRGWLIADQSLAVAVFVGMTESGLRDRALFGADSPSDGEIRSRAEAASVQLLALIKQGLL